MVKYFWNWDDGEEKGWELSDQLTKPHVRYKEFGVTANGAFWGLSNQVYFSPPFSLQLTTSDAQQHHIAAFRPRLPYVTTDYMSLSTCFIVPDISIFGSIEFFMNRQTGNERRTPAVQWWHRPANVDKWRYWKGGPFGRKNIGVWTDIQNGVMDLQPNTWHNILLEAKVLSNYVRLKVDDVTNDMPIADLDLSSLPVNPAPPGARSSTWPAQVNCGIAQTNRKLGSQTVYVDDTKFTAVPFLRVK